METSLFLAKFFGLYLLVAGLLWLIRGKSFDRMVEGFLDDPGFVALSGFIALIMGLAIITAHNVWEPNWRVVITIFGYLAAQEHIKARTNIPAPSEPVPEQTQEGKQEQPSSLSERAFLRRLGR